MSKLAREVDDLLATHAPVALAPNVPGFEGIYNLQRALLVMLARVTGFRKRWVQAFDPDHGNDQEMYRALREANIPLHDPEGWYMFLDDERHPSWVGIAPEDNVVLCRSSKEAKRECLTRGKPPSLMFLDHDLGYRNKDYPSWGVDTTMDFLQWATDKYPDWDFDYEVHSMNPVGAQNIKSFLESFIRSR
jgi:hypothetical protein